MFIQINNPVTERRARMDVRTLSKVLQLSVFHGWRPERISSPPPLASWDTEIVMPYVTPYLSGTVSNADALALASSLDKVLASEGSGLPSEIYLAVLGLAAIAVGGGFELNPEGDLPVESAGHLVSPPGLEGSSTLSPAPTTR